jgi:hypothetical protein
MMKQSEMLKYVQDKTIEIFGISYESELCIVSDDYLRGIGLSLGYLSPLKRTSLQIGYCWEDASGMRGIYLNEEVVNLLTDTELKSVLLHELVHYGMIMLDQNYMDGHSDFESKCKEVGAFTYHEDKTVMEEWKVRWLNWKEAQKYALAFD